MYCSEACMPVDNEKKKSVADINVKDKGLADKIDQFG